MEHVLEAITVQKVEVVDHPSSPEGHYRLKALENTEPAVGCRVCGMALEETIEVPYCPGRPVKDMVAELFSDLDDSA